MKYKKYLINEAKIGDVAERIVKKINKELNVEYYSEEFEVGGVLNIFDTKRNLAKRYTRGDHATYVDPLVEILIPGYDWKYWKEQGYVKGNDYQKFLKKAESIIEKMGKVVKVGGPLQSIKSKAVKIGSVYVIFDGNSFGLVTANKFKNWINTLEN